MSSEYSNIEKMFSDKLKDMEVMPSEHVWENIKKNKRKGGFFFIRNYSKYAAALLLLLGSFATIYYLNTNNIDDKNTNTLPIVANESSNDQSIKDTKSNKLNTNVVENSASTNDENSLSTDITVESKNSYAAKNNTPRKNSSVSKKGNFNSSENNSIEPNSINSSSETNEFLSLNILSRSYLKLKYLIYPNLSPFVYSSKLLKKRYLNKNINPKYDDKTQSKFSIEILGGPSYASRRLSGAGSELRNESEKATMSLQTAIKVNYNFKPSWSLQTGVILENRNEKISFERSELQDKLLVTPKQVVVYHPVLPPKIITIQDSQFVQQKVDYNFNTTNKYVTISIPLVLGYNFGLGKFEYRISAGALMNLNSIGHASVLERSGDEIILVPYKESTSLKSSVYSAVALRAPLSPTCKALLELSYYNNLSNRLSSESLMKQFNYGFNLSAGISFDLK